MTLVIFLWLLCAAALGAVAVLGIAIFWLVRNW